MWWSKPLGASSQSLAACPATRSTRNSWVEASCSTLATDECLLGTAIWSPNFYHHPNNCFRKINKQTINSHFWSYYSAYSNTPGMVAQHNAQYFRLLMCRQCGGRNVFSAFVGESLRSSRENSSRSQKRDARVQSSRRWVEETSKLEAEIAARVGESTQSDSSQKIRESRLAKENISKCSF